MVALQLLQAVLAEVAPEAPDLGGVARQAVLVVRLAAEELPQRALAPALADVFVAEVEAVLEVHQAGQQPDWCLRTPRVAATRAHQRRRRSQHVMAVDDVPGSVLALELRRQ